MSLPHFHRSWGALALILAAAVLAPLAVARAQVPDGFTVRDVGVDVTADNVNIARQQAFADGQREAFQTLLKRLTVQSDWPRLPQVSDDDLNNLVLDVGVDSEKRSSVRYIATLSVRFKPEAVRRLLRDAGIPYVEWRGRPVFVLPVLKTDNGPVLWEEANPWRAAWKSGAAQGLVPLAVPPSPPAGQGAADALQAATPNPDVLNGFVQRLGAQDLLIAVATLAPQPDSKTVNLDVVLSGTGPIAGTASGTRSYQGQAGETADAVMHRAVEDIAAAINDTYKSGNLLQFDHPATLHVTAPLSGLPDWIALREKLARSTPVRSYEVSSISQSSASLTLDYVGDQSQLSAVLMQNGLVLSWQEDHWVLQNVVAKPGSTTP